MQSSPHSTDNAKDILRVFFKHAIEMLLPYVGHLYTAHCEIRDLIASKAALQSLKTDIDGIKQSVRCLSYSDLEVAVDEALSTQAGRSIVSSLQAEDRDRLRSELIDLPKSIQSLLEEVVNDEKGKRVEQMDGMRTDLRSRLESRELAAAYKTAIDMLLLSSADAEALQVERKLRTLVGMKSQAGFMMLLLLVGVAISFVSSCFSYVFLEDVALKGVRFGPPPVAVTVSAMLFLGFSPVVAYGVLWKNGYSNAIGMLVFVRRNVMLFLVFLFSLFWVIHLGLDLACHVLNIKA